MCAHRQRESSSKGRRAEPSDVDEIVKDPSVEDEAALRLLRKKLTWKDWVLRDFLRYWYWLGAVVIDVFIPWGVGDYFDLWQGSRVAVVLLLVVLLFMGERALYFRIWPEGPWKTEERRRRRKRFGKGPSMFDRLLGRDEV